MDRRSFLKVVGLAAAAPSIVREALAAPMAPAPLPVISGTVAVGEPLPAEALGQRVTAYMYQWCLNGVPIVGQTAETLDMEDLPHLRPGDEIDCRVVCMNAMGSETITLSTSLEA